MTERLEEQPTGTARIATMDLPATPKNGLMAAENEEAFRSRWGSIQTGFVDEPSRAVKEADELVAEVMKRLAEVFAQERSRLEEQWARQKEVSTEDLRVVLQRYRSFFDRLLGGGVPRGA
jgi:thioesterase domain-containing protein